MRARGGWPEYSVWPGFRDKTIVRNHSMSTDFIRKTGCVNERKSAREATGKCPFEGSCIRRCNFRARTGKGSLPGVFRSLPTETPGHVCRESSPSEGVHRLTSISQL
jgi:hypothetical protein